MRMGFCLRAIKTLGDSDLAILTDKIEAYTKAGVETAAAENAAVDDLLAELQQDREDLHGAIRAQHGDVFKRAVEQGPVDAEAGTDIPTAGARPGVTEPQARAAVATAFGDKTARVLLDAGLIEFVTGRDFNGATYSDGRIQINLDAVTQDSIGGVLKHEAFHAAVKDWLGAGPYAALMNRMATLGKMAASSGPLKTWFDKANAAVPTGTRPEHLNEELAAYAIQQSADTKQPGMIVKWVQDFMSALRTAIIRLMPEGKLKAWALLNIQPQDLARMAVQAMQARGWSGEVAGPGNTIWVKQVGSERYTALVDAVDTQIAAFDVSSVEDAAAKADAAVAEDSGPSAIATKPDGRLNSSEQAAEKGAMVAPLEPVEADQTKAPPRDRPAELIALRKRESVLKRLKECLAK